MDIFKWLVSLGEKGEVAVTPAPPPAGAPPASVSTGVPLPPAGDGSPVTPPAFVIPDAFKDKPYLKGADSLEKVLSMLDGAETKLGQRPAGIPGENATPDELKAFWKSMGTPEKPEEYLFDYGKDDKGNPKTAPDAKIETALKQMLHKHNIPAKTASALQKDFDAIAAGIIQEKGLAAQRLDQDFDALGKEVYGAEYDKVVARVLPLIKEFVNPKLGAGVAKLNAEQLMIMSSVVDNMRAKFIKADGAPLTPGNGGGSGAVTADAMRNEARQLMATPAYTNAFDPAHEATKAKINELYQKASQVK